MGILTNSWPVIVPPGPGVLCAYGDATTAVQDEASRTYVSKAVALTPEQLMADLEELPILSIENLQLKALLQTIEDFKMGYCLLTNANGQLAGLVTNAGLRRGLLNHIDDLSAFDAKALVNPNPKAITEDVTISEMLARIKRFPFLVQFLPVVDAQNHLVGAINFNNLILGEL